MEPTPDFVEPNPDSVAPSGKDPSPGSSKNNADEDPTTSTGTIILAVFGVVSMLAAALLWFTNQTPSPQVAAEAPESASASSAEASKLSSEKAAAKAKTQKLAAKKRAAKQADADTRPPELILDWIEYSSPGCDEDRSIGVNVIELRGTVDEVTLIWRAKELDKENTRPLYRKDNQWTSYVQGIPADTDVRLLAIASGPGGETTLGTNISRYC